MVRRVRIYTEQTLSPDITLSLEPTAATHVARVLRLRVGDTLWLFNGDGHDYRARIETVERREVRVRVRERVAVTTEPRRPLTLVQGVSKGERMDWVMQKAVELGVTQLVPVLSEYGVVRLEGERRQRRWRHWRGVVIAACEQSGRAVLPSLAPVSELSDWLSHVEEGPHELRLVLHPGAQTPLPAVDAPAGGVCLAVGPEGGWSEAELEALEVRGFRRVSLGPRVLRTETAALAALAAVQTLWGDWGERASENLTAPPRD